MKIIFKNKKGNCEYCVTDINYGSYKGRGKETFVGGGYLENGVIRRRMPTKLFKCGKTNRPCLNLSGKMYAVNIEDDRLFSSEILDKAGIK